MSLIAATDLDNWLFDACIIAQMRGKTADAVIRQEARLARSTWGRTADNKAKQILKLLQKTKRPAAALSEILSEADFEVGNG